MRKEDILNSKKGRVLLICGTGPSVSEKRDQIKEWTKRYDSIGMDWFCKSAIPTKYYFVRDQVHHSSMISFDDNETIAEFSGLMNEFYQNSIVFISKLNKSEYDDYGTRWDWGRRSDKIRVKNKLIIPEKRTAYYKSMKEDFFTTCYRYSYDLFCILQFAVSMKYDYIYLIGFDLNDNKCFWNNGLRKVQIKREIKMEEEAVDFHPYCGMLNYWKNNFRKKLYCLNEDSRLVNHGLATYMPI